MGITDPTEAHFKGGVHGWDLAQWRKLPLLFGYSAGYVERVVDADADVGTNYLTSTAASPGEIWVVLAVAAFNNTSGCTSIRGRVYDGSNYYYFFGKRPTVATELATYAGMLVLSPGWLVEARFDGCTEDDDLYLDVSGYKMMIEE